MAVEPRRVLSDEDLNDADQEILDVLHDGRVTPRFAADEVDRGRSYVSQRLKRLAEHGHVEKLSRGLYELVEDPRDDE